MNTSGWCACTAVIFMVLTLGMLYAQDLGSAAICAFIALVFFAFMVLAELEGDDLPDDEFDRAERYFDR